MSEQNASPDAPPAKKGKPWPIIIIASLTAFWIIGPYISYYTGWFVPEDTSNKGVLIEPPPAIADLPAVARESLPESLTDLHDSQWHLLIPVALPCGDACEKSLYTTRQVHIRLAEKGQRVERIAINIAGEQGEAYLASIAEKYPELDRATLSKVDWTQWLSGTNVPSIDLQHSYLLVHPDGHAILYYTADHHGNDLLDDIKHGLRFTPE